MKNPREIDALYKSVAPFSDWASCSINHARWSRYTERLNTFREQSSSLFERAREIVKRATAIDTGAIEGLYNVDRGWTISVAMETAIWEARIGEKGEAARALIESQLRAYDYVLDFVTEKVPIAEAWIRTLHQEICAGQDTYRVMTEVGWQNQTLPLGEYKHHPNHVEKKDGAIHAYAPVDQTPSEMRRFVEELQSAAFQSAHPLLQAAYAHYALVWIHPFADGNGRVARALASVFTYRAASIPLMVLADRKREYLDSLSAADEGDAQAFVNFVLDRIIDAVELVGDSLTAAGAPSATKLLSELRQVYVTKGGYTHDDVDQAGKKLLAAFQSELQMQIMEAPKPKELKSALMSGSVQFDPQPNLRGLSEGATSAVILQLETTYPARAIQVAQYTLALPVDTDLDDCIVIRSSTTNASIEVRMSDLTPDLSVAVTLRVRIFAEAAWSQHLAMLLKDAKKAAKKNKQS